ncbi:hypothetical protein [Mucilaginibacter sp.]
MLYLIVLAGAVAITVGVVKVLSGLLLKDLNAAVANPELSEEERKAAIANTYNPSGCVILPVMLVIFFAAASLLIWREIDMEKTELETYGRIAEATVKNGSSFSSRKFDFSNLVLGFKTAAGDSVFTKYSVSAKQFSNYYKNQTLPVIYSSRYPSILKVATTQEEIDKYNRRH